ncbi:DUF3850 domain-containing protein [Cupriavidus necator]
MTDQTKREAITHPLKSDHGPFQDILSGRKKAEVRRDDRDFRVGDRLNLLETVNTAEQMRAGAPLEYTGGQDLRVITHVQRGYGLPEGVVVLSFDEAPVGSTPVHDTAEEDAYVINRLSTLLADVAIALKGPDLTLHRNSYHDLPEVAQILKMEVELYRATYGERLASDAARDALAERRRQVESEGWTPEHDDAHASGVLAAAAFGYLFSALNAMGKPAGPAVAPPPYWPWDAAWFKPGPPRRMMEKAAALVLAEMERIDRAAMSARKEAAA